jgi:hypothetical protein
MIERGAPLRRSYVGQTQTGTACLSAPSRERGYVPLKLVDPSFNITPCAVLLGR